MPVRLLDSASLRVLEQEARTDSAARAKIGQAPLKPAFFSCGLMLKERYDLKACRGAGRLAERIDAGSNFEISTM